MKPNFQRWLRFMVENMFINRDYEVHGRRRLFLRHPKPYKGPGRRARAKAALRGIFGLIMKNVETKSNNDGTYTHTFK